MTDGRRNGAPTDHAAANPGAASAALLGPGMIVRGLGWDIGLPLIAYYTLHLAGASDWAALIAGSLVAGARIVWVAVRTHTPNPFAMVMVVSFGMGFALAFVTGDARFLLLKDSMTTAAVGLMFLVLAALGQPLTLAAAKTWRPEAADRLTEQFRTNSGARHWHLTASTVWGAGLLVEAALRVPLVYLLPIHVMVGVSAGMMILAYAVLILWTGWYLRRVSPREASGSTSSSVR
jgi:hypothetical protein